MEHGKKPHRKEKIDQLLKEEIGRILLKEIDLDKQLFVTITQVRTSSDLAHATIFFSTLVRAREEEALRSLEQNVGEIQHLLNRKLRMRPVPKIRFTPDVAFKKEQRLYELLDTHKNDD